MFSQAYPSRLGCTGPGPNGWATTTPAEAAVKTSRSGISKANLDSLITSSQLPFQVFVGFESRSPATPLSYFSRRWVYDWCRGGSIPAARERLTLTRKLEAVDYLPFSRRTGFVFAYFRPALQILVFSGSQCYAYLALGYVLAGT